MHSHKASMTPPAKPPTTYVQADLETFRDLVQRLTGAPASSKPSTAAVGARRNAFKLHDRRGSNMRSLELIKLGMITSPRSVISGSPTASPIPTLVDEEEEERVIREKGYYLHPSPRGTGPPELLTLFPLCSPKQQQLQHKAE